MFVGTQAGSQADIAYAGKGTVRVVGYFRPETEEKLTGYSFNAVNFL